MKTTRRKTWFGRIQFLYVVIVLLTAMFLFKTNAVLELKHEELSKNIVPTIDVYSAIERIQIPYEHLYVFLSNHRSIKNKSYERDLNEKIQTVQAGFFVLLNPKSKLSKIIENPEVIDNVRLCSSKFNKIAAELSALAVDGRPLEPLLVELGRYREELNVLNGKFYYEQIRSYDLLVSSISDSNHVFKFVVIGWLALAVIFAFLIWLERIQNQKLISQRKKALEQKLIFVSMFNHEIRNPLQIITASIETLVDLFDDISIKERESKVFIKMQKEAQTIDAQFMRVESCVKGFADFARLDSRKMKPDVSAVDVCDLINKVVDLYEHEASKRGTVIEVSISGDLSNILTDPVKLDGILRNLLDNAVKYTSSGRIDISASRKGRYGKTLEIIVKDTGCGIDPRYLQTIFEPFVRANEDVRKAHGPSVGLGLSIVKLLVKILDGVITVKSNIGTGTVFVVKIPHK